MVPDQPLLRFATSEGRIGEGKQSTGGLAKCDEAVGTDLGSLAVAMHGRPPLKYGRIRRGGLPLSAKRVCEMAGYPRKSGFPREGLRLVTPMERGSRRAFRAGEKKF